MDYQWAKEMNCAVTVCDTQGIILFMNDKAKQTFAKHGDLIGKNLFDCHSPSSQVKINELLATGGSNAYTIEKGGIHKVIYQTAWFKEGIVAGLVEISMPVPATMPHFVRK
ncbi:MAG: PAS domain-containing protein [Bacteroides sp.]